jgi:hypothetical protein
MLFTCATLPVSRCVLASDVHERDVRRGGQRGSGLGGKNLLRTITGAAILSRFQVKQAMSDALERSDKQEDARFADRDPFKVWKSRRKKGRRQASVVVVLSEPDFHL